MISFEYSVNLKEILFAALDGSSSHVPQFLNRRMRITFAKALQEANCCQFDYGRFPQIHEVAERSG